MRKVPLVVDIIIVLSAIWFFAAGWLVLALLVTWVEPFVSLYDAVSLLWAGLGALVERLGAGMGLFGTILGLALQGLVASAIGLLLIGVWAMLPVWGFVALGYCGELLDRLTAARRATARQASAPPA